MRPITSIRAYVWSLPLRYSALVATRPLFEAARRDARRNQALHDLGLPWAYGFVGVNERFLGRHWSEGVFARFKAVRLLTKKALFEFIEREHQFIRDNWPETWPGERTVWSG